MIRRKFFAACAAVAAGACGLVKAKAATPTRIKIGKDLNQKGPAMQIHFDRSGKSSVKFTKTEMQALQKAKGIVGALADHCRNCELANLADATDKSLSALVEVLAAEDPIKEAHDRFVGELVS